ncbi:NRDE family protein [uncultured Planktosalinus sp.]|uniref:NRDE family protein n=1 Tax=uncultured Planktosalinus sp. TaxID=1810935 RepID=UPI0030DA4656
MCTVTFIAKDYQDFILTSSRDELPERQTLVPKVYNEKGTNLIYPKDLLAGGTWIGVSSKKRMVNLLNGAFKPHKRKPPYRKSRGVVVKDILLLENLLNGIMDYDYEGIEPFTIILVDWKAGLKLYNLVWDEQQLHFKELSLTSNIWSSSPLYSTEMKNERETWFNAFLKKSNIDSTQLIKFHKTAGNGKKEENLIMDRGFIKTVSLTQIIKKGDTIKMNYENLQTGRTSCVIL